MPRFYDHLNRTACDVLEEMRKCYKTRNFSYLEGLTEELQAMANSMESSLYDQKKFKEQKEYYQGLKKKIKQLEEKKESLSDDLD
jgi:hypothetical protein